MADSIHPNQCSHGQCLNHKPEWEKVGDEQLKPDPALGIFNKKTYWLTSCCGTSMSRYKKVQIRQCGKCARQEEYVTHYFIALCLCCGGIKDMTPPMDF